LTITVQGFPKRLTDRKAERSVTYAPSIDKEKLVVRAWTGGFWQSEHAPQGQTWRSFRQSSEGSIDDAMGPSNFCAQTVQRALNRVAGQPSLFSPSLIVAPRFISKRDLRVRQRDPSPSVQAMGALSRAAFEKLSARGSVDKKIAHIDHGPKSASGWHDFAALGIDRTGVRLAARSGGEGHLRHRCNGGQCLAPKTQRVDPLEFAQARDFAGGMPGQCE
jgi:hypothetical protein